VTIPDVLEIGWVQINRDNFTAISFIVSRSSRFIDNRAERTPPLSIMMARPDATAIPDSSFKVPSYEMISCWELPISFVHRRNMARDIIRTPNAPSPPPTYSQAVRAAGLVFVSGTGPQDPITGKIVGDTIQEQTRQCLANVSAILRAAGTSLERVVSVTVILLEESDFAGMNEEWIKWFPANPPARQGAKLPVRIPGMRVSLAAIAEA
jgi:2-iminobutanoate/2-iminopropanoate deaminase